MTRKRVKRAKRPVKAVNKSLGFSNERFLEHLSSLTGIQPVGVLGRDTPLDLSSLEAARGSLLIRELFSKYDDGVPSAEKEATTWERFQEAEAMCQQTNGVFYALANRDPYWVNVRRRVWDALGKFSWDEASRSFGHGPGGTTRLPRARAYAAYKYSGKPESTSGNAVLSACAIAQNSIWTQIVLTSEDKEPSHGEHPWQDDIDELLDKDEEDRRALERAKQRVDQVLKGGLTVVEGNCVITVPKNYKTHRCIAKEPDMNVYVQKGLGACIRKRLTKIGVTLNDQTRNQRAALQGSIDGKLATLDLSMASDTLSYEVVSWLLPNDWWWALEQSRSPVGVLPCGTKIKYHKFSSMGNGYTFELESLIFWAIVQQVCRPNINERDESVCVYGDDLVVPTEHYESVVERLSQAGFKPNLKKSFAAGPFRESCGKQYYSGADITPYYVRKPVAKLDRLFLVHNNAWRWMERTGVDSSELLASLRSLAPASWRTPRLPDGYGDGAFIGHVDELRMDSHPHGWEYWQVSALVQTSIALEGDLPVGQMIASLNALSSRKRLVNKAANTRLRVLRRNVLRCENHIPRSRHYDGRGWYSHYAPKWALDVDLELPPLDEALSGLPVREGQYEERKILVPRYPAG